MLLTSSRDNWERLVTAVVKKQQIWELCHQQSISTISSSDDLSEWTHSTSDSFSVHPSPRFPPEVVPFSQVSNNASSRPFARMLLSVWYRMRKSKDKDLVDIPAVEDPALKRFSLRELQVATDKFSNKNIVRQERFWDLYKGCLADGSLVDHNDTHVTAFVGGNIERIAPEYLSTGEMSEKTDVYAYGITLLEIITGQRAFNNLRPLDWVRKIYKEGEWERMVDADCESNYMGDVVKLLLQVSVVCTRIDPKERPKMCEVVRMLEDGDSLGDETWKEWIQDEFFRDKLSRMKMQKKLAKNPYSDWVMRMQKKLAKYPYSDWVIDDDFIPKSEELLEPR